MKKQAAIVVVPVIAYVVLMELNLPLEQPNVVPPPVVVTEPVDMLPDVTGEPGTTEVIPDGAYQAKVVGVVDGDTIDVLLEDNTQQRIRVADIDCPETRGSGGQPFGKAAKKFVSELCFGQQVHIVQTGTHWERIVGYVLLPNGEMLQHELLRNGLAWHARKYSDSQELQKLEDAARAAKIGIWSQLNPIDPSQWRKGVRPANVE